MRQLATIGRVLVSPLRGFRDLLERPRAALAVLVLIAAAWAAHAATHARIDPVAQERITAVRMAAGQAGSELSDEEVREAAERALALRRLGGYGLWLAGLPAALGLLALLLWLAYTAWGEGLGFRRCYRLMVHACLPFALRQLLAVPIILDYPAVDPAAAGDLFVTDLGGLLGPAAFPGAFLFDPFWMWSGLLVAWAGRAMGHCWLRCALVGAGFWILLAAAGRML